MRFDELLQLPSPCRSGQFCETCRSRVHGAAFRAQHGQAHAAMFAAAMACAQGLPWEHRGPAPWAAQFAASVRGQVQQAAMTAAAGAATFGPGDVVKLVLHRLGYRIGPNCGCEEFRAQMNAWGWAGCFRRRGQVIEWFLAKAREQGIAIDGTGAWSLIRGGLKDLLRRRPAIHATRPPG